MTGLPPLTQPRPTLDQLGRAARWVMRRFEVGPQSLREASGMPYPTALAVLDLLARWHIVTAANGGARRLVLMRPEHAQHVMSALIEHNGQPPDPNPLIPLLTPAVTQQMRRVLQLIVEGRTFQEIGNELEISENTVKTYVKRLYAAVGARRSLANLVHMAHLTGLLPTPVFQAGKDSR